MRAFLGKLVFAAAALSVGSVGVLAQTKGPVKPTGKTILRDSDGNVISDSEFVDIRMANFHYPDATVVRNLENGTTELRLQKVPQEGMRAPEFAVKLLDGREVSLASLRGKVVVLNFWFIACPVCRAIKPKLNEFKAQFGEREDVVFLAVTNDSESSVRGYLKKEPSGYLQAAGAGDALAMFKFGGYPKNIVISKTGEIVYWRSTIRSWEKFQSVVRGEIAKSAE